MNKNTVKGNVKKAKDNIIVKTTIWSISAILVLIVAGLAFLFFSPDYDLYFVRSGSMNPAINIGDIMIAGPVIASSIKPGDVITYQLDKNLITHRVLSIDGDTLITKGDANEDQDPYPVQFSQVKSCYLFKVPYIGYVSSFLSTRLGWFLIIILPALALVGFIIKDIVKEALKNEKTRQKLL
jgi:signal peptidase